MNKDLGVWTYQDCALVLIDYQKEIFALVFKRTSFSARCPISARFQPWGILARSHHSAIRSGSRSPMYWTPSHGSTDARATSPDAAAEPVHRAKRQVGHASTRLGLPEREADAEKFPSGARQ